MIAPLWKIGEFLKPEAYISGDEHFKLKNPQSIVFFFSLIKNITDVLHKKILKPTYYPPTLINSLMNIFLGFQFLNL